MKSLWSTIVKDKDGNLIKKEKGRSNLFMDITAALFLHRMFSKFVAEDAGLWGKLKYISLGDDNTEPENASLTALKSPHTIVGGTSAYKLVTKFEVFDNNKTNQLLISYEYINDTGAGLVIAERGLSFEYDASKLLFNRLIETEPWTLPIGGVISGEVRITLNT